MWYFHHWRTLYTSASAHLLYKDNPFPLSVVIMEAHEACNTTTACNGRKTFHRSRSYSWNRQIARWTYFLSHDICVNLPKHTKIYHARVAAEVVRSLIHMKVSGTGGIELLMYTASRICQRWLVMHVLEGFADKVANPQIMTLVTRISQTLHTQIVCR